MVPRTYIRWFMTACNSGFRGCNSVFGLLSTSIHIYIHIQMHDKKTTLKEYIKEKIHNMAPTIKISTRSTNRHNLKV